VAAVLAGCGGLEVIRIGDNVIARTGLGRSQRLILAGHLDTVPPSADMPLRRQGDVLWGLGAADMKGGLAVMLELARDITGDRLGVDVTWVLYAAEEVARAHSGLLEIERAAPELLRGDAAVLGEPTGARIEAGCQGVLKVDVVLGGARAHTARPWTGINAVHRLTPVLAAVASYAGREPVVDGCRYREALQAVRVTGGVAGNVVPDSAVLSLNHRFAPDRRADQAEAALRELLAPVLDPGLGDRLEVVDMSPAAPPGLDHPLLARLCGLTGHPPRAKLGWTDVAFFSERGIPAVNFGPGDPEVAHRADERVSGEELVEAYRALASLLTA